MHLWITFANPILTPNSDVRTPIPVLKEHVKEKWPLPAFVISVFVQMW